MAIDVQHVLSDTGPIAQALDGYEPRPQQQRMAGRVEQALGEQGRLLVEAGTGVGKTFAYLLPALQRITDHNERVVISTHTISLQEQLIQRDIPLLRRVLPEPFKATLVKGRGNYISVRRLALATKRRSTLFADAAAQDSLVQIQEWAYETTDGSLATLPQIDRRSIWDRVQSDAANCMGRNCPTYDKCFYQAARREMARSDLLICNHALFFSDLALRAQGASLLPPYDHVILDEAHQVEDVACDHFGRELSEGRVRHLLGALHHNRTGRGFLATLRLKGESSTKIERTAEHVRIVGDVTDQFFRDLDVHRCFRAPASGRVTEPDIVENTLTPVMRELSLLLKELRKRVEQEADAYELNAYAERALSIAKDAEILIEQAIPDCVYWLEQAGGRSAGRGSGGGRGGRPRVRFVCAPVDVAPILRERLFGQEAGIVLTSATLTTGSGDDEDDQAGFSHLMGRLGCEESDTLQLGSPFDHASQVELYVDDSMPEPASPDYVEQLTPRIVEHVGATDGGAFVLFTSYATMGRVVEQVRPILQAAGHAVYVQGEDGSRSTILDGFRNDERAVLFGTQSFWQGVDVRGQSLRNVIITRLPFDPPDRPLTQARAERIALDGGSAFMQDQLPRAVIRFKQGFGRLIRSAADTGRVVVLDPRILRKRYGRFFLRALPDGVEVRRTGPPTPPFQAGL